MKTPYDPNHLRDKRYPNDWTHEDLEKFSETTKTRHGVTIPLNVEIKADQKILDYSSIEEILKKAQRYALFDCICRTRRGNCDAPLNVCIALDEVADKTVEAGELNPRYATYEEVLEAVKKGHREGLVLMAYSREETPYPTSICNCCTCCCTILGGILRFGVNMPISLITSDKVADHDAEKCISCGACIDRCHFDAWENVHEEIVFHQDRCFGCGNCVTTCPSRAITMKQRPMNTIKKE